jgi:hypothetical protein
LNNVGSNDNVGGGGSGESNQEPKIKITKIDNGVEHPKSIKERYPAPNHPQPKPNHPNPSEKPVKDGDGNNGNGGNPKYCHGDNCGKGCHGDDCGRGNGNGDGRDGGGGHDGGHDNHNDNNNHHSHGSHDHHHDHDHNYHNDKHYHNHDDNNYYYYYSNDYSSNHATVILQLDYHGSSNHDNIRLEIGNDFDTTINFAGEPEDLVVTGLDLDDGEDFSVCLENEDSGKVNCVDTSIRDQDEALYVDIRVP